MVNSANIYYIILKNIQLKGGDENSRKRHLSKGKLLPRERIEKLLDER